MVFSYVTVRAVHMCRFSVSFSCSVCVCVCGWVGVRVTSPVHHMHSSYVGAPWTLQRVWLSNLERGTYVQVDAMVSVW